MKLHRLELTGFGPFLERQTVDFDAFDAEGVFLISGRTGAGKSSILDGVSFALYGSVPRYDGGERRLRSDHCAVTDPTEVRLEFTVGTTRWRVTRAPEYERPAKRGGGLTTEPTRAELEELVDGTWIGRAAKPREVGILLDEILGLNAVQFQQVILLAQNKFSRFLLAKNDERQALLRTLFGTRRFDQYRDDLETRRKAAQQRLDTAGEHARTLLDLAERVIADRALGGEADPPADLAGRREAATRALQRADYRVEQLATQREMRDAAAAAAAKDHADLVALAKTLAELASARAELSRLEAEAPRVTQERELLARARAAEALRAPIELAERAESGHRAALTAAATARDAWIAAGGGADDDLAATIDRLTGDLARWEGVLARERELATRETERRARAAVLADLDGKLAAIDAQRALVPAERARLDEALVAARSAAARLADLRDRRDAVAAQLAAAQEAVALAEKAAAAESEYATSNAAAEAAVAAVTALLQRRLAGYAGELSAQLVDGEPCAVCGSTSHPRPAEPGDDPVTDAHLAAAEAGRDAATTAARAAGDSARQARERHAAAVARAGGRTTEALEAEHAGLTDEVAGAALAEAEVAALTEQRAELDALDTAAAAERDALAELQAAERTALAGLDASIGDLRAEVEAARGDHETVADRVAEATDRRERARAHAAAQERLAERTRALAQAVADRDERIAASDLFADVGDVASALLAAPERAALETRIADHAASLTATRARLLELELATVDSDSDSDSDSDGVAVDLAAAARAVAEADTARTAAIAEHRDSENAAEQLRELLQRADDAYAAVAAVADEAAVVTRLADTVAGRAPNTMKMELETFVLAAELEQIVAAANLRLDEMSAGRYSLHHTDARQARGAASGLGIEVLDSHTGRLRSPQSLSGGETFLASLALALGLAEVVTNRAGGVRLDTLFVDEGFGSLDDETLDLAMRTIDELRRGGRTVGLISHVAAMKEQLPARLVVETTPHGPSVIRQDAAVIV